jgi:hypothetical protein
MDLDSQIHTLSSEVDILSKRNLPINITTIDVKPSIDGIERDEKIIRGNSMREVCLRDKNELNVNNQLDR